MAFTNQPTGPASVQQAGSPNGQNNNQVVSHNGNGNGFAQQPGPFMPAGPDVGLESMLKPLIDGTFGQTLGAQNGQQPHGAPGTTPLPPGTVPLPPGTAPLPVSNPQSAIGAPSGPPQSAIGQSWLLLRSLPTGLVHH